MYHMIVDNKLGTFYFICKYHIIYITIVIYTSQKKNQKLGLILLFLIHNYSKTVINFNIDIELF